MKRSYPIFFVFALFSVLFAGSALALSDADYKKMMDGNVYEYEDPEHEWVDGSF